MGIVLKRGRRWRSSRVSCERIAYFLGGDCCAAGFQAGLRPLWVRLGRPATSVTCPFYPQYLP
jgi:hypothetical protein